MIETLTGLPEGVLGFEATGELHADDYRSVLIPAIEQALQTQSKVRIVLVFPEFAGMSGGAAWQDLQMGVEHLTTWERIALVTDVEWMIHLTSLFGWMTPGEMKHFPMAERDAAIAWAAGDS
jgi:hypothetical protein